LWHRG